MGAKLKEISTEYHSFVENQVLTAQNLNELVNYLTDQNRLSRICLSGVGLACGFKVSVNSAQTLIKISQGVGVTTDGDLLYLSQGISGESTRDLAIPSVNYRFCKAFEDNDADYAHFRNNNTQIPLWKLIPEDEENSSDGSQMALTSSILANKVVILYLENYTQNPEVCTTSDCDNQGNLEHAQVHVLLANVLDVVNVINPKDSTYLKFDTKAKYMQLPELNIKKINVAASSTSSFSDVIQQYESAINQGRNALTNAINILFNQYNQFTSVDFGASSLNTLINNKLSIQNQAYYVQYQYDVLRDLMDTYQEIKDVLFDIKSQCCPNIAAFPKHLLLGRLQETQQFLTLRHEFYKSPIIPSDYENIEKFNFLLKRFETQLNDFNLEFLNLNQTLPIKITPSIKRRILGQKAIPAYYQTSVNLVRCWDFDKTRKLSWQHHLGYHRTNLSVQEPLQFSFEDKNFYRIEGIQGQNYNFVHSTLDALRKQYGLSFDIQLISTALSLDEIEMSQHECHFADLEMQYKGWLSHINCLLANVTQFFSGFSTNPNGSHNYVAVAYDSGVEMTAANNFKAHAGYEAVAYQNQYMEKSIRRNSVNQSASNFSIKDYLHTNEFDLGSFLYDTIDDCSQHSAPQLIIPITEFQLEDYTVRIIHPISLLQKSSKLAMMIPDKVGAIQGTFIRDFNLTAKSLCQDINETTEQINNLFNSPNSQYVKKGFEARYINVLDDIKELCCAAKFMETLSEEMERRKQQLFERLSFSNFAVRNPGMEHWAGVQEGGTFVLVYGNDNANNAGKVLADFALPYMCCSDCAPINFVIAERELATSFLLETNHICIDDRDKQEIEIAYHLTPENAVVKVVFDTQGLSISENQIIIDPINFQSSSNPIHFTINNQPSTQTLLWTKKPRVELKNTLSFSENNNVPVAHIGLSFEKLNDFNEDDPIYQYQWVLDSDLSNIRFGKVVSFDIILRDQEPGDPVELNFTLNIQGAPCDVTKEHILVRFAAPKKSESTKDPEKETPNNSECEDRAQKTLNAILNDLNQIIDSDDFKKLGETSTFSTIETKNLFEQVLKDWPLSSTMRTKALKDVFNLMKSLFNFWHESKNDNEKVLFAQLIMRLWILIMELIRCLKDDEFTDAQMKYINALSELLFNPDHRQIIDFVKEVDGKSNSKFANYFKTILDEKDLNQTLKKFAMELEETFNK